MFYTFMFLVVYKQVSIYFLILLYFIHSPRYNLDPFSEHADESIWQALEKSHLKDKVNLAIYFGPA